MDKRLYGSDGWEKGIDEETKPETYGFEDLHVHVVEDEEPLKVLYNGLLRSLHVGSHKVIDHNEDDAICTQEGCYSHANVLLTDVNNANSSNGNGLAESIRRVRTFLEHGRPVIVMSADTDNGDIFREEFAPFFESGMCQFISKPFGALDIAMLLKKTIPTVVRLKGAVSEKIAKELDS